MNWTSSEFFFHFKSRIGRRKKTVKRSPELPDPISLLQHSVSNCYVIGREMQRPLLKEASVHIINFAIVKIICKICIINIIKSLVGKTSDMTRVKGSLGRAGL